MRAPKKILLANRGEIAIRVMRTAQERGISCVAIYAQDDTQALHRYRADESCPLNGTGARAYLDGDDIVGIALDYGCDAIHPGYGFLSESAEFASACEAKGLTFIGPSPDHLALFGNKAKSRALAQKSGVALLPGTLDAVTLKEARDFMTDLPPGARVMLKALAGGGGRGMRLVEDINELEGSFERCQSEARASFGEDRVFVEQYLPRARHIEVQIIGDGKGKVSHLYERECTLQRRNQKVLEIAPSPSLPERLRDKIVAAAIHLAKHTQYRSLGTFEFLVDAGEGVLCEHSPFYFMEVNPRIQVEHTVTEEILGLDLVAAQLDIASGKSLEDIALDQENVPSPRGYAVQARINMEELGRDGTVTPSVGKLTAFDQPSGPGIRHESLGYAGYIVSANYDSLLAKLIVHTQEKCFTKTLRRLYGALCEYRIEGVGTNIGFLLNLLSEKNVSENNVYTSYIAEHIDTLIACDRSAHPRWFSDLAADRVVDAEPKSIEIPPGTEPLFTSMPGVVVSVTVDTGDTVRKGEALAVIEAMKMEHEITAPCHGFIERICIAGGDVVGLDTPILFLTATDQKSEGENAEDVINLDAFRPDLDKVVKRHAFGVDENRPDETARRHRRGRRTARENIADLSDDRPFFEYGPLVVAAQRRRRSIEELIQKTPADGLVAGIASVNGELFDNSNTVVLSYDYSVLAGTQGVQNHRKMDRLLAIAEREKLPVIIFAEGGGGRPGDTDTTGVSGLDCVSFHNFAKLSGKVPLIGIASGRCFAGNAALFGCCDVTIATSDLTLGMGGPAMIEGGGMGRVRSEDIGPVDVQSANGVLDIVVDSDADAVRAAKQYLGFFQGCIKRWSFADQRKLRHLVPESRVRAYDIRKVIETLADINSVQELRSSFGIGMITAFARIEGRPLGLIANNPSVMGGAITSDSADKAARFMQLCNVSGIPLLFLCDTPGIMVGPDAERTGTVRHAARLMVTGANLTVPYFTIITRKAYGLGALAMAGGSFQASQFAVSWPTGEMGPMGIEGGVALGFRDELNRIEDLAARKEHYEELVAHHYELGKAINVASHFEIDDVIDPAMSRDWISNALSMWTYEKSDRSAKTYIDTW